MKFARLLTILLSVLTVLSLYQDKALARPADRIVQPSHTEFDNVAVVNALAPLPPAVDEEPDPDDPKPEPKPKPKPEPDPFPDPLPDPPYSS